MTNKLPVIGTWRPESLAPAFGDKALLAAIERLRETSYLVRQGPDGSIGVGINGSVELTAAPTRGSSYPLLAILPPLYPEWLGERSFLEAHRLRFPYVVGEMANGIATAQMVISAGRAGLLGFFGAAGLSVERIAKGLDEIESALNPEEKSFGSNLIHSPNEAALEDAVTELYLQRRVRRVSASAYMALTPAIVRYAASGLAQDSAGKILRQNYVFAKISRPEVARRFLSPAPKELLDALVRRGALSAREAELAARVPVAEDITVEADSGGHTDNQTLTAIFPMILNLRDELAARFGYERPIRVGAAGGLGTPAAVAAAFGLGAAYVLTGSINQSAIESGLSMDGKKLLAVAGVGDVVMAPAADMFELGVKVQVLKRGTMFGARAQRLYDLYSAYSSLEEIPAEAKRPLERDILARSAEDVWQETRAFFLRRDPHEVERAEREPKHKMALVFRWYLGLSSKWAISGEPGRRLDYQIWCGPAMAAFNDWVRGSFLAEPENRSVAQIAKNLLEGAAIVTRAHQLRSYGVHVPLAAFAPKPIRRE